MENEQQDICVSMDSGDTWCRVDIKTNDGTDLYTTGVVSSLLAIAVKVCEDFDLDFNEEFEEFLGDMNAQEARESMN